MGLNCRAFASELRRLRLWSTESRADHGLENFGDSLYPYGKNGRHVGTRTPDLYRVKTALFGNWNNQKQLGDCQVTQITARIQV
jgi:hypothetical protein